MVRALLPTCQRGGEFERVQGFLCAPARRSCTLIIDIRGNLGGAPTFWEELFVERLIDEP
jgi:hypothetical protein